MFCFFPQHCLHPCLDTKSPLPYTGIKPIIVMICCWWPLIDWTIDWIQNTGNHSIPNCTAPFTTIYCCLYCVTICCRLLMEWLTGYRTLETTAHQIVLPHAKTFVTTAVFHCWIACQYWLLEDLAEIRSSCPSNTHLFHGLPLFPHHQIVRNGSSPLHGVWANCASVKEKKEMRVLEEAAPRMIEQYDI